MTKSPFATPRPQAHVSPGLPRIDWASIGGKAPQPIAGSYGGPTAPLPKADIVVMTWANSEWMALDYVFLDGASTKPKSATDLQSSWHQYSRDVGTLSSGMANWPLWGYFRSVSLTGHNGHTTNVLLFKSNSHLSYPPYMAGLTALVKQLLSDTGASWLYSIGTAGGGRDDVRLGDVVITSTAYIRLTGEHNLPSSINNTTIAGDALPSTDLLKKAQDQLFIKMNSICTDAVLATLLDNLHSKYPESKSFTSADLVNAPLTPSNLGAPRGLPMPGQPLLTTDAFYIASVAADAEWSALEMDDAVVGEAAKQAGRKYVFVRNISDPVVPFTSRSGAAIPQEVRTNWSGDIFKEFGMYTSFNGALATWALITSTS